MWVFSCLELEGKLKEKGRETTKQQRAIKRSIVVVQTAAITKTKCHKKVSIAAVIQPAAISDSNVAINTTIVEGHKI